MRTFRSALLGRPEGLRYERMIMARSHRLIWLAGALMMVAASASAQVDPLLFLKTATPNVIFIVDTGNRMQRGAPTDLEHAGHLHGDEHLLRSHRICENRQ